METFVNLVSIRRTLDRQILRQAQMTKLNEWKHYGSAYAKHLNFVIVLVDIDATC